VEQQSNEHWLILCCSDFMNIIDQVKHILTLFIACFLIKLFIYKTNKQNNWNNKQISNELSPTLSAWHIIYGQYGSVSRTRLDVWMTKMKTARTYQSIYNINHITGDLTFLIYQQKSVWCNMYYCCNVLYS